MPSRCVVSQSYLRLWPILSTEGSVSSGFSAPSTSSSASWFSARPPPSRSIGAGTVADRDVGGFSGPDRQGEADRLGQHRIERGGLGAEGDDARARAPRRSRLRGRPCRGWRCSRFGRWLRRSPPAPAPWRAQRAVLPAPAAAGRLRAGGCGRSVAAAARRRPHRGRECRWCRWRQPPARSPATSVPVASATRRVSVENSIVFRNAISLGPSGCCSTNSSRPSVTGTSSFSLTSSREMRALSALSMIVSRRFSCLISPARSRSVSRSPNCSRSCAAVFGPMPGTPGTLSTESPVIACRSIIFSGGTPHFSMTSGTPIWRSFIGSYIDTVAPTSCIRSLSDEMMVVSAPASRACRAIGRDQVVGLETLHLDAGQVERARGLADQPELRDQIVGRRRAVGLVVGVELVAEGLGRIVENDREMRRRHADIGVAGVQHQLPHHVAEAEHRIGRQTVRLAIERRQGVIGPENIAGAVDEEEMVALFHGGWRSAQPSRCPPQRRPEKVTPDGCRTSNRKAHAFVTQL